MSKRLIYDPALPELVSLTEYLFLLASGLVLGALLAVFGLWLGAVTA